MHEPEARPLGPRDIARCIALSTEAGWNQTGADWLAVFDMGEAIGLFRAGRLVASAAYVAYGGRLGWICMVLVTPAEQRRGHATRLLRWAVDRCAARGLVAGLDATSAGEPVYARLGFRPVYSLTRLMRRPAGGPPRTEGPPASVEPLVPATLADLGTYDRTRFGADRADLLARWQARRPNLAFLARSDGRPSGFILAREGRTATSLGPLVADDAQTARALLSAALARTEDALFIDLAAHHAAMRARLDREGFMPQRTFLRMLLGHDGPIDRPETVVAAAGPEFG